MVFEVEKVSEIKSHKNVTKHKRISVAGFFLPVCMVTCMNWAELEYVHVCVALLSFVNYSLGVVELSNTKLYVICSYSLTTHYQVSTLVAHIYKVQTTLHLLVPQL